MLSSVESVESVESNVEKCLRVVYMSGFVLSCVHEMVEYVG